MLILAQDETGPNVGDAWCLAASVSSAIFILRLEGAAATHNAARLQCASMFTTAALCLVWLLAR